MRPEEKYLSAEIIELSTISYIVKIFFGTKGEIKIFSDKKTKKISYQQTYPKRMAGRFIKGKE